MNFGSEAICCKFPVTFFQLLVHAFQTMDLTEFCMLFLVCLKCLGKLHIDMSANTRFDHHTLIFHVWGHSIPVVYSAPIENGQTLQQRILMPAKQFATARWP